MDKQYKLVVTSDGKIIKRPSEFISDEIDIVVTELQRVKEMIAGYRLMIECGVQLDEHQLSGLKLDLEHSRLLEDRLSGLEQLRYATTRDELRAGFWDRKKAHDYGEYADDYKDGKLI